MTNSNKKIKHKKLKHGIFSKRGRPKLKMHRGFRLEKEEEKNSLIHGVETNFKVLFELSFVMFVSLADTKNNRHVMHFYCIKSISPLKGSVR